MEHEMQTATMHGLYGCIKVQLIKDFCVQGFGQFEETIQLLLYVRD